MAKKKKDQSDGQLSIFDALVALNSETDPVLQLSIDEKNNKAKSIDHAQWIDSFEPHTDYICESDPIVVFCYDLQELEEINPYLYNQRPFEKLLQGLAALSRESTAKKIRSKSFTIYSGDISPDFYFYGIGLVTSNSEVVQFMQRFLQQVEIPSRIVVDTSTSDATSLMPRFRYDKGYVIEYVGEEGAGSIYIDDDDNYKSGITIHTRAWKPSCFINKRQSVYGKLVDQSV